MIMKKLLFFATALLILFATDSFAKPKPKEKEFYLDKDKLIRYYGFAVKKIPAGEGTIYDRHGKYKITLSGTFDGNIVKNARLTVSHPKNEVQYKGDQVEFKYSQDTVSYILGKGTFSRVYRDLGDDYIAMAQTDGNVIYNMSYASLKHEEQMTYEKEYKAERIYYPSVDEFMEFYGSVPAKLKREITLCLSNNFIVQKSSSESGGTLEWSDGTSSRIKEIDYGYYDGNIIEIPRIDFPNGNILSRSFFRKTVDGGIVEVEGGGKGRFQLPDSLVKYNKIRETLSPYKYDGVRVAPFGGWVRSNLVFHIQYSDGSHYDGEVEGEHYYLYKVQGIKTVPDSSLFTTGLFKSAKGVYSLYYGSNSATPEKLVGYRRDHWYSETPEDFIKNTLQAQRDFDKYKAAQEEAKAEQERLEREEQERQEKEAKEREDKLVRTYGKYYTEFRDNGKILLGAPIKMFKELTTVKLQINRRDLQVYEVWYGDSFYDYMYCEVNPKTGKVTGTRTNPWNE